MRLLYAAICVVLVAWTAFGAPPQAPPVREKPAQAPPVRDDPNQPAPPGYQWQKVGNEPWKLVAVPGVATPRPFQPGFSSTPGISANGVVLSSTQLAAPVPYRTLTPTGAPSVGMFGFTNGCPPSG